MNHINVSVTVDRKVDEAAIRFEQFLREYAPETEMNFTLRAPFDLTALNVGFTLHRDVTARITPLAQGGCAYAVAWQPVEPGPFPSLSGTIFIAASETSQGQSTVTLDGHYHPPLGVAGEVFDAVLGKHIAQASASDLIDRFGAYLGNVVAPEKTVAPAAEFIPVSQFA
jgi:hypothetical protein